MKVCIFLYEEYCSFLGWLFSCGIISYGRYLRWSENVLIVMDKYFGLCNGK